MMIKVAITKAAAAPAIGPSSVQLISSSSLLIVDWLSNSLYEPLSAYNVC